MGTLSGKVAVITEDLGLDRDLVNRTLGGWEHMEGVVRRIDHLRPPG